MEEWRSENQEKFRDCGETTNRRSKRRDSDTLHGSRHGLPPMQRLERAVRVRQVANNFEDFGTSAQPLAGKISKFAFDPLHIMPCSLAHPLLSRSQQGKALGVASK